MMHKSFDLFLLFFRDARNPRFPDNRNVGRGNMQREDLPSRRTKVGFQNLNVILPSIVANIC